MKLSYHKSLILLLISSMILVVYVTELSSRNQVKIKPNKKIIYSLSDPDLIALNINKQKFKRNSYTNNNYKD